ncbi:hypothetical protein [Anabaena sp. UHCC 0451]|uniref:hypothetical protein n=1 Tax=Anabaena sp. UHCC 0451 TaxID=2055235 RepID=UPI002B202E14|nr:hypothetical protein [Anabaena sp. UHCC 0451]MEA5576778.1 hypothetical protein [Anabaena sp. UHCC 0451]
MIQSLRVRSRIGKDGLLQIQLPQAKEGTELDIIVVYELTSLPEQTPIEETMKLSDFYGCIQDETFIRHPQCIMH